MRLHRIADDHFTVVALPAYRAELTMEQTTRDLGAQIAPSTSVLVAKTCPT